MKIPRIPSPGLSSGKNWSSTGPGKGSSPRNISNQFKENFENISGFGQSRKPGFTRTTYLPGGVKIEESR